MIYTLGNTESYRKGLNDCKTDFAKLGRTPTYFGGAVWQTAKEVQEHIDKRFGRDGNFSIWEIDADWNNLKEFLNICKT